MLDRDNEEGQADRLQKLAAFQLLMIKHAMKCIFGSELWSSCFSSLLIPVPRVRKIVYSTCSIHATENEHVVRAALNSDEALSKGFKLASPHQVLPTWPRRGLEDELDSPDDAASLVRCSPTDDGTNGFFVSCFVRPPEVQLGKRKTTSDGVEHDMLHKSSHRQRKRKKRRVAAKPGTP